MTASDAEIRRYEIEQGDLQRLISQVEAAMAASTPGTRGLLESAVQNARNRIGELDRKIKETEAERAIRSQTEATNASLAARETALNEEERKTYAGFLAKEFFTKRDFGALERFYGRAWDKLSDGGKEQMSLRIWNGVRQEEFTFGELPTVVRAKEEESAYKRLTASAIGATEASRIPESDRMDFIRAYERGDSDAAAEALSRPSFKRNMFAGVESSARKHVDVEKQDKDANHDAALARLDAAKTITTSRRVPTSAGKQEIELSGLDLGELRVQEAETTVNSAAIPNAKSLPPGTGPARGD